MINIESKNDKIISGGLHYCRIVEADWQERLKKLINLGCNTVETYIPWNFHEYCENEYVFDSDRNIRKFIMLAHELGLEVIIRIGPYICAEWEFGGIPSWLLKNKGIRLRSNDSYYIEKVERWWKVLFDEIGDLQKHCGGPIIMLQIENEYGYYSNDKEHLSVLSKMASRIGWKCQQFTSDGLFDNEGIIAGNLIEEGVLPTLNMGGSVEERYKRFREIFGEEIPFFNMEYWVGWFNLYGQPHLFRSPKSSVTNYIKALEYGHSNIYVFNGGTNFGFYAGANEIKGKIEAAITSYDYDGILTESGERSHKYDVFRSAIGKYVDNKHDKYNEEKKKYLTNITLNTSYRFSFLRTNMFKNSFFDQYPLSQEDINQIKGFTLYSTNINVLDDNIKKLKLNSCHDRAHIFVNNALVAIQYENMEQEVEVKFEENRINTIDIIVENLGRVNLHQKMDYQHKGICHSVQINEHIHTGWSTTEISLDELFENTKTEYIPNYPTANYFEFNLEKVEDTYIDISKFGKGYALINKFNLGSYWNIGPQTRLYIPKSKLKIGKNKLMIFDIEGLNVASIELFDKQLWISTTYEI